MELSQDFKEFIDLLNAHKVEYLVVGGYAVNNYGFVRATGDIDFWVKPGKENADRVIKTLLEFGFGSLDIDENDFINEDRVVQLGYPPYRIDIMTSVSGLEFDECMKEKSEVEFEGQKINFISLHHLRINKEKTGRDKDNLDLKNLPKK
jgi:hypothetical protein